MTDFIKQNWGNVASVLGLVVSVWVLFVAQKARDAAEQARSSARLRSLLQELEVASSKIELLGTLIRNRKWEIVQLLTDDALTACQSALARWGEQLIESKNSLLDACKLFRSISDNCRRSTTRELTEEEWHQTMWAQREAREQIGTALGYVRRDEERRTPTNA